MLWYKKKFLKKFYCWVFTHIFLGADWTSPDGLESTSTFAAILHDNTNYETFYAGKYLNRYDATAVPRGWNQWVGLKGNSKYYNYDLNVNGVIEHHGENYEEDYLTDVIGRFALKFLNNQTCEKPFFMMLGIIFIHKLTNKLWDKIYNNIFSNRYSISTCSIYTSSSIWKSFSWHESSKDSKF